MIKEFSKGIDERVTEWKCLICGNTYFYYLTSEIVDRPLTDDPAPTFCPTCGAHE
jgi:rubrerythrin